MSAPRGLSEVLTWEEIANFFLGPPEARGLGKVDVVAREQLIFERLSFFARSMISQPQHDNRGTCHRHIRQRGG